MQQKFQTDTAFSQGYGGPVANETSEAESG